QADRGQQQYREEEVRLVAVQEPGEAAATCGLANGEGQGADVDVGVLALVVGVGVVAVVVVEPGAVGKSDGEVRRRDPGDVVGAPRGEDRPVPGVVGEEPDLGEDDGEDDRDGQLPPGVADQHEGRPAGSKRGGGSGDLPAVVAGTTIKQARL